MFAGCAYRQRTGSCSCRNAPIGCVRDAAPSARISFPTGINSYAELRAAAASQPQQRQPPPPPREVEARAAQPLPLRAAGGLPALGWRVSAEDTCLSSLAPAGVLFYVEGEAAEETVRRAGSEAVVSCVVASAAALESSRARLGRAPAAVLLSVGDAGWEAEWAALHATVLAGGAVPGLAAPDVAAASAALRLLAGAASPKLLALPMHPGSPQAQRALVGLCRRMGVRLIALQPLGDAALRSHQAVFAAGERRGGGAVEALLAWSVGRGAVAVVGGSEGGEELPRLLAALMEAGQVLELESAERAALDGLAASG